MRHGRIVFVPKPERVHVCPVPKSWRWRADWTIGTVWECDCGKQWIRDFSGRNGIAYWRACLTDEYVESGE